MLVYGLARRRSGTCACSDSADFPNARSALARTLSSARQSRAAVRRSHRRRTYTTITSERLPEDTWTHRSINGSSFIVMLGKVRNGWPVSAIEGEIATESFMRQTEPDWVLQQFATLAAPQQLCANFCKFERRVLRQRAYFEELQNVSSSPQARAAPEEHSGQVASNQTVG
ncbi:hypothetical protein BDV19DRAFT_37899 [Aspergillus venezuelensis]